MQELTALRSQARGAPKSSTLEESLRSGRFGFGVYGFMGLGFRNFFKNCAWGACLTTLLPVGLWLSWVPEHLRCPGRCRPKYLT